MQVLEYRGGWGPDNEEKARHQEVQQQRFDELSKIYDKSHPVGELTVDGQTIRQSSVSNRYGTTKVFESQNLTDKQIHNYAQQLAGDTPLKEVRPGIYTAKLNNGTSITLRNLSSSQEQTGARWTIDIRGNQQLAEIAHKYGLNRPGFPGECFICELRLPDHRFRWKHNKLFLLLPEEYGPAFPAIVDCYTSPPT